MSNLIDRMQSYTAAYNKENVKKESIKLVRSVFNSFWLAGTSRYPIGTNIYAREWDALLILDGCRVDAIDAVSHEYDFIRSVDSIWSVGSSSHEWMAKTFVDKYADKISETAHISTNAFARRVFDDGIYPPYSYTTPFDLSSWNVVDKNGFCYTEWLTGHVDPYLKDRGIEVNASAEYPTDRAILTGRNTDCEKLLVHYFQPHRPFIGHLNRDENLTTEMDNPYEAVEKGKISTEELWESYLNNLRYVLDNISILLNNLDARKVIITADHGELHGEWNIFGHPAGVPHPALKKVPWIETTASDEMTYEPESNVEYQNDYDPEEHLRELGYL